MARTLAQVDADLAAAEAKITALQTALDAANRAAAINAGGTGKGRVEKVRNPVTGKTATRSVARPHRSR